LQESSRDKAPKISRAALTKAKVTALRQQHYQAEEAATTLISNSIIPSKSFFKIKLPNFTV